jgi:hypothetical protein
MVNRAARSVENLDAARKEAKKMQMIILQTRFDVSKEDADLTESLLNEKNFNSDFNKNFKGISTHDDLDAMYRDLEKGSTYLMAQRGQINDTFAPSQGETFETFWNR